jgi:hypothetical protein
MKGATFSPAISPKSRMMPSHRDNRPIEEYFKEENHQKRLRLEEAKKL